MDLFKIGKTDTKLCCSCQSNEENVASVLGTYMSKFLRSFYINIRLKRYITLEKQIIDIRNTLFNIFRCYVSYYLFLIGKDVYKKTF